MKADDIKRLFPHASRSLIAANAGHPELFGNRAGAKEGAHDAVRSKLEPSDRPAALRKSKAKDPDSKRFLVRITSVRRILLDEDNLCEKFLVDCCRYAGLIPGDSPGTTKIEVTQRKAVKEEDEHTIVEIFAL